MTNDDKLVRAHLQSASNQGVSFHMFMAIWRDALKSGLSRLGITVENDPKIPGQQAGQ